MLIFTPNKTSAQLLVDYATTKWRSEGGADDSKDDIRYLLIYDLYIKARSYALINKAAFLLAVVAGIMVVAWPSLATITEGFGFEAEFLKSAVIQTTITGLAALTFGIYSHYKKRQMYMENLMRHIVYSEDSVSVLKDKVLKEMERIDSGFGFSEVVMKTDKPKHNE